MEHDFVVRTYDLITITNCYDEIFRNSGRTGGLKRKHILAMLVCVLAGGLSFLTSVPLLRIIGMWLIIIGIGLLFMPLLKKENHKRLESCAKDTVYSFGEDGFEACENGTQAQYSYADITRLRENSDCYMLFIGRVFAFFLPKQDFAKGDAEAFRGFISRKTEMSVRRVRG